MVSSRNPFPEDKLQRQREKILQTQLMRCDRECPFSQDLCRDSVLVVDPHLPVLAELLSLVELIPLGGTYDLFEHLWSNFCLTLSSKSFETDWLRKQILVSIQKPSGIFSIW